MILFSRKHSIEVLRAKGYEISIEEEKAERLRTLSLGRVDSDETRQKKSEANKGKVFSDEHKRKLSEARRQNGVVVSDAQKEAIRNAAKNRTYTEEQLIKHGERTKKSVIAAGNPYPGIYEAASALGISYKVLRKRMNDDRYPDYHLA